MQYTKALHGEDAPHLTPDQEAIRVQVASDQGLLRERINRLTGEEGLARMEAALETLRARFVQQRAEAHSGNPVDVPVEIVQVDSLGHRIGSDVSSDVSGAGGSRGAPVVGGLSAAFGGRAAQAGGQVSGGDRTPPARSQFRFAPSSKPAPLEVPADEPSSEANARSSGSSGKSPGARRLFGGEVTEISPRNQEGYAPLFTLGRKSPVLSNAPLLSAANETLPRGNFENIHMVHELLYDPEWRLTSASTSAVTNEPDPDDSESDPATAFQSRLGVAMEKAFWDSVKEKIVANPPEWERVVGLVAEVRGELEGLVPAKWKDELAERMDTELLQQVRHFSSQSSSSTCTSAYQIVEAQSFLHFLKGLTCSACDVIMKSPYPPGLKQSLTSECRPNSQSGYNTNQSSSTGRSLSFTYFHLSTVET